MKAVNASSQQLCGATVWALWNKLWLVMLRYMGKMLGGVKECMFKRARMIFECWDIDKLAMKRKAQDASNNKRGALTTTKLQVLRTYMHTPSLLVLFLHHQSRTHSTGSQNAMPCITI